MKTMQESPGLARWFLQKSSRSDEGFAILGDYEEEYGEISKQQGVHVARRWYWQQTAQSIIPFCWNHLLWRFTMFGNYLKVAFRNIKNQKGYSFINIAGLSVGMTCCILLVLYINAELNINNYHEKANRIHRLCAKIEFGDDVHWATASNAVSMGALVNDYPEVEDGFRVRWMGTAAVHYDDNLFYENNWVYTDPSVFNIMTWPLIEGDIETALTQPYSLVLTTDMAEKYFGDENPIGKTIRLNGNDIYTVTGIMENIPLLSTHRYDALASFSTCVIQLGADNPILTNWIYYNFETILLLKPDVDHIAFNRKIEGLVKEKAGEALENKGSEQTIFLQPLEEWYLRPLGRSTGPYLYVAIFSVIAVFVLILACVNFMNLATARSANRAREVGMRKVMGAQRKRLIFQFISEAMLYSICSAVLALMLSLSLLPLIRNLTQRELNLAAVPWLWPALVVLAVLVGLMAGAYPAFYLTRFHPIRVLQGKYSSGSSNKKLRRTLVIFQFVISIALIIGTTFINAQLDYMKNRDPGFQKEHIAVLRMSDAQSRQAVPILKQSLSQMSDVINVGVSSTIPGFGAPTNDKIPEGYTRAETQLMDDITIDEDLIPTLGLELLAGRNFSLSHGSDPGSAVIINETAARRFGWDNVLGKTIQSYSPGEGAWINKTVIGLVKDFHIRGMNRMIEPVLLDTDFNYPIAYKPLLFLLVRISPQNISVSVKQIEAQWKKVLPEKPFDYFFLDDSFDRQFRRIERSRTIFSTFTGLAIFIACLGLFGMSSFSTEQRTKEVGIRKVLGCSTLRIVTLLSKELLILVVAANVIAWPLAFIFFRQWLETFPYRIDVSVMPFIASTVLVLLVGCLTVAFQAIKTALANPVDSLKYE